MAGKTATQSILANSPERTHRFHALDSMRGLAALVVVLHHFFYMWFYTQTTRHDVVFLLFYPLISGHESVILFFLLSGFVLSMPYLQGRSQGYGTFLLRRVLRIYCPYLFALALAVAGNSIWHGTLPMSKWADSTWATPVKLREVMQAVVMLGSYDWAHYNTAFWSLVHEMRISIIFPFLFLFVRRIRTWFALALALALCLVLHAADAAGLLYSNVVYSLQYVAVFTVGILLALHQERLRRWYSGLSALAKGSFWVGSLVAYSAGHLIADEYFRGAWMLKSWHLQDWPVTIGSAGFIVIALESGRAKRFLATAIPTFLGRISYSLYLVHATVLFAVTFLLPDAHWRLLAFCLYLPASLGVATIFCLLIEEPFTRLGRRVGKRAQDGRTQAENPAILPAGEMAGALRREMP